MLRLPRYLRPASVICLVLLVTFGLGLVAASETTRSARVDADIRYLSSDELEGRGPGTAGLDKAAEYIRNELAKLGLKSGTPDGSYMQSFQITLDNKVQEDATSLTLQGPDGQSLTLQLNQDYQPLVMGGGGSVEAPLVFVGYGIAAPDQQYDEYRDVDVEGKVLVMIRREPQQESDESVFDGKRVSKYSYVRTKLQEAKNRKAAAVLFVNDPLSTRQQNQDSLSPPNAFGSGNFGVPFAHITLQQLDRILDKHPITAADGESLQSVTAIESYIDRTLQPVSQPIEGWSAKVEFAFEKVQTEVKNVVAVLEGSGPLAEETILIGAHYDHLGFGGFGSRRPGVNAVHNGADDNASGTAALLELARRFTDRDPPARRMVFIAFSAEERGLIGSNYYVSNPLFPLDQTVAMLNFDMVGQVKDNTLLVYGIGTAPQFEALIDPANARSQLKLSKHAGVLAASDHYPFYRQNVPSFHLFSGLTEIYHTPDDDYETINVVGVMQSIDFAEDLLVGIDSLPERPTFAAVDSGRSRGPSRRGMAYLGITPDYNDQEKVKVVEVAADSPAEKGGLKAGDVIIRFADAEISNLDGLSAGLRDNAPGTIVKILVLRDDQEIECAVTLERPSRGNREQ